jgi:hypothetical protein
LISFTPQPIFFPQTVGGGNFPRYRPLYSHYYSLLLQLCRYEECDVDHIYWAFHWCNHWWWSPETCTLQAVWLRVRRFLSELLEWIGLWSSPNLTACHLAGNYPYRINDT